MFRFKKVEFMSPLTTSIGVNVSNAEQQRQTSSNKLHIVTSMSANFSFMIFFGFYDSIWAASNINVSDC